MAKKKTASANTKKIGGKTFTKHSCSAPKTTAAKLRKAGYTARVIGGCVWKGPKAKKKKK